MESGLEGRNNGTDFTPGWRDVGHVSMESGLEGRNNYIERGWITKDE